MDQNTWNLLFSWLTGKKCFLPEGCTPPLPGVLFYLFIASLLLGTILHLKGWKPGDIKSAVRR